MIKTSYSYKEIWKVAYPILLTLLIQNLIQVTDTAFLGRVGEVELGASAIAGIYYVALFTLAFGFSVGSQILIGRRNGEGNYNKIGEIVVFGSLFLWLMAGFIFGLTRFFSEPILNALIDSPNVLIASLEYLDWRIYGLFFSTINVMFRAFFVGTTRTKVLTYNAILMGLANVLFDYLLIFGKFGFPEMGIAGAGLASVIAEAISVVFFLIYTGKVVDLTKYGFKGIKWKDIKIIKSVLNISVSLMLQSFLALSTWFIFFLAIEKMGELSLASSNVIRSFYMIIGIPIWALGTTANTLVSNAIGAGKQDEVISLIWKIARFSILIILPMIAFMSFFPELSLSIYTTNQELIQASTPSLYVILTVLPFFAIGNIFFQSVSGTGNTRSALKIEIITLFFYCIWMWFVAIYLQAPLAICWTTELEYALGIGVLSLIYFYKGKWRNKQI